VTLLSTGLLLGRHAPGIVRWCDDVIVSLDGDRDVHDAIRNVPGAFDRLAAGVRAIRALGPGTWIGSRCVVQRSNHRHLPDTIEAARLLGLNQISFLAADVSSEAFNRPEPWGGERVAQIGLDPDEARDFADRMEQLITRFERDIATGFIAETPDKLRRIARHFLALHGLDRLPPPACNAPWVSAVVEADGTVRPCFFHKPLGNVHEAPLDRILNSDSAVAFRRSLDVRTDGTCRTCVCTLRLPAWSGA
jgi:MoaA/NifB/PqqE/SkfB family radical SAM enzyme